jgi:hypothetical protein
VLNTADVKLGLLNSTTSKVVVGGNVGRDSLRRRIRFICDRNNSPQHLLGLAVLPISTFTLRQIGNMQGQGLYSIAYDFSWVGRHVFDASMLSK